MRRSKQTPRPIVCSEQRGDLHRISLCRLGRVEVVAVSLPAPPLKESGPDPPVACRCRFPSESVSADPAVGVSSLLPPRVSLPPPAEDKSLRPPPRSVALPCRRRSFVAEAAVDYANVVAARRSDR